MNKSQRKTLQRIFEKPTPTNIRWADIVSLLKAAGADVTEGAGSRVRVLLGDRMAIFHAPHPQKEAQRYCVRDVRDFLNERGITP